MLTRASIVTVLATCLALEAAPASADLGVSAHVEVGVPAVGFTIIGGRRYYRHRPGWGYIRGRYGWYRVPRESGGYIVIRGRHYYERSPGWGYRHNRYGWYRVARPGGYILIGGRRYYERAPGPGYRRSSRGWYKYARADRGHRGPRHAGRGHGRGHDGRR